MAAASFPADRARRAFTAIELIMVLVVVAVAAAVVIPLAADTETVRLRQASRMLVADIEYAQMQSMAHGDDGRIIVFTRAGTGYSIATVSRPGTPVQSPVDGGRYVIEYGSGWASELDGVTIAGYALGGDARLGFGMYGELDQATPATITLGAGGRSLTITLAPETGEATIGDVGPR